MFFLGAGFLAVVFFLGAVDAGFPGAENALVFRLVRHGQSLVVGTGLDTARLVVLLLEPGEHPLRGGDLLARGVRALVHHFAGFSWRPR